MLRSLALPGSERSLQLLSTPDPFEGLGDLCVELRRIDWAASINVWRVSDSTEAVEECTRSQQNYSHPSCSVNMNSSNETTLTHSGKGVSPG